MSDNLTSSSSGGSNTTMNQTDEPCFPVGTRVTARYKGAFCSAQVKAVARNVYVRVKFDAAQHGSVTVPEDRVQIWSDSLVVGLRCVACHPPTEQYLHGRITCVIDKSSYKVEYDDGDTSILKRRHVRLPGERHFREELSLDCFPLLNPDRFGAPVRPETVRRQGQQLLAEETTETSSTGNNGSSEDINRNEDVTTSQESNRKLGVSNELDNGIVTPSIAGSSYQTVASSSTAIAGPSGAGFGSRNAGPCRGVTKRRIAASSHAIRGPRRRRGGNGRSISKGIFPVPRSRGTYRRRSRRGRRGTGMMRGVSHTARPVPDPVPIELSELREIPPELLIVQVTNVHLTGYFNHPLPVPRQKPNDDKERNAKHRKAYNPHRIIKVHSTTVTAREILDIMVDLNPRAAVPSFFCVPFSGERGCIISGCNIYNKPELKN